MRLFHSGWWTRPATASEAARALALKGHKLRKQQAEARQAATLAQLRDEVAVGIVARPKGEWA